MKTFKILLVIIAVLGLVAFGLSQYKFAKADEDNGNGESGSHGLSVTKGNEGKSQGQEAENEMENESEKGSPLFSVQPNGNVRLNGANVVSNSGGSLGVKIFGLNLNINTASSTELIGLGGTNSTASDIKVGDTIDVKGKIDAGSGIITADQIRDETLQQQNIQGIQQQIQALLEQISKLREQLKLQHGL